MNSGQLSPLDKVRARAAELLELKPVPPIAPDVDLAIYHIDRFLRRPDLTRRIKQNARIARASLRAVLKLL